MFLTPKEITALTGYERPSAQVRWLRNNGWKITVNALGRPIVALAEVNRRLVGGGIGKKEPNWGALDGSQANAG